MFLPSHADEDLDMQPVLSVANGGLNSATVSMETSSSTVVECVARLVCRSLCWVCVLSLFRVSLVWRMLVSCLSASPVVVKSNSIENIQLRVVCIYCEKRHIQN